MPATESSSNTAPRNCSGARERRGFFRINDDVVLTYHLIDDESYRQLEQKESNSEVSGFTLKARFAAIDQSLRPVMNRLQQHSEDLATCLNAIDEKLSMLAEALFTAENDVEDLPSQEVNLSAGGISFHVQKPVEPESILQLKMLLLPSRIGIVSYARVVYCQRVKGYEIGRFPYKVGVEFQHMREEDSDLIIRHMLCKEADARRHNQEQEQKC